MKARALLRKPATHTHTHFAHGEKKSENEFPSDILKRFVRINLVRIPRANRLPRERAAISLLASIGAGDAARMRPFLSIDEISIPLRI